MLTDAKYAPKNALPGPGGAIMYWHADDLQGTLDKLLAMAATVYEPVIKRGEGFITASVIDPFDNILGIMYNVHYLEVVEKR